MADFKLLLGKSNTQIDTELGIIDINQIENSTIFSIEIFPFDQSNESFESAEFNNFHNIADEDGLNPDFFSLPYHPSNWTWEQRCDVEQSAIQGIYELIKTVKNVDDLKDMSSVGVIYVLLKDRCPFCGKQLTEDDSTEYIRGNYCCNSCFTNIQSKTYLTNREYNRAYAKGKEYLIKVAEKNGWVQNEIFEESENQGNGYKYGLTLVGYEDEDHEVESGVVSIDSAHLELYV